MPTEMSEWVLEWWEVEWIATILGLEHTEQEAVGAKQDTGPDQNSQLLSLDILHARNLQCKSDGCE